MDSNLSNELKPLSAALRQQNQWRSLSDCDALVARGAYPEALQLLEGNDGSAEGRLAWIRCHAETGSMPLSALVSALDDVAQTVQDRDPEMLETMTVLVVRLVDRDQLRLAAVVADRLWTVARRALPAAAQHAPWELARKVLVEERKRAEVRRESKGYLSGLDTRLSGLDSERPAAPSTPLTVSAVAAPKKASRRLDAKAIMERATSEAELAVEPAEDHDRPIRETADPGSRARRMLTATGIASVLIGMMLIQVVFPSGEAPLESRLAAQALVSVPGVFELPELQTMSANGLEAATTMEAVTRRLENLRLGKTSGQPTAGSQTPAPPDNSPRDVGPQGPPADAPSAAEPPRQEREPAYREPPPAERQREQRVSPADREKLPDLDADRLAGAVVQDLERGQRMSDSLPVGPDGRRYGDPLHGDERRSLDGAPLRAYPVEQLNLPELYSVIARTKVLSAPSLVAQDVDELEPGATIQVVAKMGRWLEIRSQGGRRGFIYSQDATPGTAEQKAAP